MKPSETADGGRIVHDLRAEHGYGRCHRFNDVADHYFAPEVFVGHYLIESKSDEDRHTPEISQEFENYICCIFTTITFLNLIHIRCADFFVSVGPPEADKEE